MKLDLFTLPQPYPDETWYSIVARYHRHAGNIRYAKTQRELFGRQVSLNRLNPLEMDNSIVQYVRLHGCTHGTDEECFTKFTLAPYHLRYYSAKRKKEVLKRIRNEEHPEKTNVSTNYINQRSNTYLRYCPICLQEDMLRYGESYWHRAHQIGLVDKCPLHGCKLLNSTVTISRATYHFSCADELFCPSTEISYEPSALDHLAPYVVTTLDAPFSFHETAITDSLVNAALDTGYGEYRSKGFVCKASKLETDIRAAYGDKFVSRFIVLNGSGTALRHVFYRNWNSKIEPALLVASFLKVPVQDLFKEEDREMKIREEFLRCSQYGFRWPRSELAKHLGIKESRLYHLAKELNVEPFWGLGLNQKDLIEITARFYVTEEQRSLIDAQAKKMHAASRREFLWYCVRKELGI